MKQSIKEVDVQGKRVLMRVDFNVPIQNGNITDDRRIQMALPSIQSVLQRGGKLTLISHLGRPSGDGFEEAFTLKPVADRLSELLETPVAFDESSEDAVVLRENLRFDSREKSGDDEFGAMLAEGCDIYCNDAFGTAHRNHASMVAVPTHMQGKPRVAGLLLERELKYLDETIKHAETPFVAVLGGAKVSDKLGAIDRLIGTVDTIVIGGAMAYTLLAAKGVSVGNSLVELDLIEQSKEMLERAKVKGTAIQLPSDHVCATQIAEDVETTLVEGDIPDCVMGLDIGPMTTSAFAETCRQAKTIVWNGPMGVFECEPFSFGTKGVAEAIAEATAQGAVSIVGGGDSAAAIAQFGLETQMTHISTGGGASLQMLEGKEFLSVSLLDDTVS